MYEFFETLRLIVFGTFLSYVVWNILDLLRKKCIVWYRDHYNIPQQVIADYKPILYPPFLLSVVPDIYPYRNLQPGESLTMYDFFESLELVVVGTLLSFVVWITMDFLIEKFFDWYRGHPVPPQQPVTYDDIQRMVIFPLPPPRTCSRRRSKRRVSRRRSKSRRKY